MLATECSEYSCGPSTGLVAGRTIVCAVECGAVLYSIWKYALYGFLMVPETFLGSPRVHPSHSPTLAERRSPSRSASTTSSHFKDALEHLLEDAAWGLPHAAATTNHEQQANLQPCTPSFHAAHIRRRSCNAPVRNTADSL